MIIILLDNFDIDHYITLDVEDKSNMLNDICALIDDNNFANMPELGRSLKAHGILSTNVMNSVLCVHTRLIRLYFNAVYHERKYGRGDINKKTGEILENKETGNE